MERLTRSSVAIRLTFITLMATAILAVLKLVFGHLGHSHALIADGIHSVSDLFVDILVLLAAHYGGQKADWNHPYGHGRIETAATFGLALILFLAGIGIIFNASDHLIGGVIPPKPNSYVLWVAFAAILINEILFRYSLLIARRIKSNMLEANAWHSRSDAAASVVVFLGAGGALLGRVYLDVIGAVIVGLMICKMGGSLAWRSISELVDTGVDEKTLSNIKTAIIHVPGVKTLHQLRTRTIGNAILVDVHILVDPQISVSEGHYIGDQVYIALNKILPNINDITVHVDPEDDEETHFATELPSRGDLLKLLRERWKNLPEYKALITHPPTLHYLGGKVYIELFMPLNTAKDANIQSDLLKPYKQAIADINYIAEIKLFFK